MRIHVFPRPVGRTLLIPDQGDNVIPVGGIILKERETEKNHRSSSAP